MYRNVNELNQNELEELRTNYYYKGLDDGSLFEVIDKEINSPEDIPMSLIFQHYDDISFVDEDFFCNL